MPSPTRDCRRWTRKKPTVGASTPTTAPTSKARRMNSSSNMHVRRVVPDTRQLVGATVEDDAAAHEHDPLDEALDGAELVRDVDDGGAQLAPQLVEQRRQRLLRRRVDACRR